MISEIRSSENETDGGSLRLGRCGNGRERDKAEGTFQGEQCYFSTCFGFELCLVTSASVIHQLSCGLAARGERGE